MPFPSLPFPPYPSPPPSANADAFFQKKKLPKNCRTLRGTTPPLQIYLRFESSFPPQIPVPIHLARFRLGGVVVPNPPQTDDDASQAGGEGDEVGCAVAADGVGALATPIGEDDGV